mgnify:CR=1 FL=1
MSRGEVLPPIGGRGIRAKRPRSQGRTTTCAEEARYFPDDSDIEHRAPFGDRGGPITGGDAGGASREDVMGGGPPAAITIYHQRGQVDAMAVFCREPEGDRLVYQVLHVAELVLFNCSDPAPCFIFGRASRARGALKGVGASDIA